MQTQDLNSLIQALQMTFGPTQQNVDQGTTYLKSAQTQPNYACSLLMIGDNVNNSEPIRLAAIVNMKTFLDSHWKQRENQFSLPEHEKELFRNSIIDAMTRCVNTKKLRSQYEDLTYKLVSIDFPQAWPNLIPQILGKLQSYQSVEELFAVLLCLRRVCECYQFMIDDDRKPLEPVVSATFPILEALMQKFLSAYNDSTGPLVEVILKIFHHATHLQMPNYMKDYNAIQRWMLYIQTILQTATPVEIQPLTIDADEEVRREKTFYWTNKKWSSRIILRFIQKHGNKTFSDASMKDFVTHIQQNYLTAFMEIFFRILTNKTQFQGPRTCLFGLKYLYYALRCEYTLNMLKPHLEKLMFDIAIPRMQLTPRDDQIWKNEPEEYIRRLEDFSVTTYNLKNAANDLLLEICKQNDANGNPLLMVFLNHTQICLDTQIDPLTNQPLDLLKKEALFWGIETLCAQINKIPTIADSMELMLEKHILPEFANPVGFLRARACYVFDQYGTIAFKNKNNVVNAVRGISQCIMDKELPVRVAAAISFSSILQHSEAQELIRPQLSQVLEIYIKLMDVIDNEKIVSSLEDIVKNFTNEIIPYAYQLASHLATIFQKYCNKQNQGNKDDSDDDGEAELAAAGCLEAIKRILNSPLIDEQYTVMEPVLFPLLNYAMTETGCDFINEALEILNLLLYKRKGALTPGLWFYYPVLVYVIIGLPQEVNVQAIPNLSEEQYALLEGCKKDWGTEFVANMLGSFRNYMQKGGQQFLTATDFFGQSFVNLLFQVLQKIYSIADNGEDETDQNQCTTLLISLIENFIGQIDYLIPQILEFSLINLQKPNRTNRFKMVNIGVLCVGIWYNAQLAINYFDSKQVTAFVFQTILALEKSYRYEWDINRVFYGLCQSYLLPQPPLFLLQNGTEVARQMVRLSTKILQLREEEESCDQEEQAIEDNTDFQNTLNKLASVQKGQDIEDDDDEEDDSDYQEDDDYAELYDSPLEEVDAILLFEKLLLTLQATNPQVHQILTALTPEEQAILQKNIQEAKVQYQEWLELKNKPA